MLGFYESRYPAENVGFRSPGGGSGIRTHDTVARIHAFQACAFSHSAIPPRRSHTAGALPWGRLAGNIDAAIGSASGLGTARRGRATGFGAATGCLGHQGLLASGAPGGSRPARPAWTRPPRDRCGAAILVH